jgi:hypothetical protein
VLYALSHLEGWGDASHQDHLLKTPGS